ncbi:AsnC family transcriptional regulator [Epidermidibacterium keratini]|uniref:AsnC family transcriptional regulator n=1 Tax=Epidermidibacterium keratini TaxID=1891644 RepID=A0A7L4YPM0_9ACTN|nr:Lrp/AsnC family transcriptional regulator [Epidermidibacterium keratini]QHC00972.1 AsnC family transcriptional regulator [Epidermidibacterium keratini]
MTQPLSELDLSLIHALQIRPRAPWQELARVLNSSPATLARHWERVRADGLSWVTAYPTRRLHSHRLVAFVEVRCALPKVSVLCGQLARFAEVASIEQAVGNHTLLLTILVDDLGALSRLVLDEFPQLDGIESTTSHVVSQTHLDGSYWRLGALTPTQVQAVSALPGVASPSRSTVMTERQRPIASLLATDGRMTAASIAAALDRPERTVRRELDHLLRQGTMTFRCEIAQSATPTPIWVNWWCRVAMADVGRVVRQLRLLPQLRMCSSLTGPANLIIGTWNESLQQARATHEWLERELAPIEVIDSSVTLRCIKRMGWLLDPNGRATGEVIPTLPALS